MCRPAWRLWRVGQVICEDLWILCIEAWVEDVLRRVTAVWRRCSDTSLYDFQVRAAFLLNLLSTSKLALLHRKVTWPMMYKAVTASFACVTGTSINSRNDKTVGHTSVNRIIADSAVLTPTACSLLWFLLLLEAICLLFGAELCERSPKQEQYAEFPTTTRDLNRFLAHGLCVLLSPDFAHQFTSISFSCHSKPEDTNSQSKMGKRHWSMRVCPNSSSVFTVFL